MMVPPSNEKVAVEEVVARTKDKIAVSNKGESTINGKMEPTTRVYCSLFALKP